MQYVKAGIIGLLGSLVMFIIMLFTIHGVGIAPFKIPPSAAFVVKLGLPAKPLTLIVHFLYGAFWAVVFAAIFKRRMSIKNGLGLALVLWLIMMLIYSPIIGWGLFGFGDTSNLKPILQLGNPVKYLVATLVLHIIYGLIIGGLTPLWVKVNEASDQ